MKSTLFLVALAAALTGCETPREAMGTARHTAGMVGSLETELATFKAEQNAIGKQRLAIIRENENTTVDVTTGLEQLQVFKLTAGSTSGDAELERLRGLAKAVEDADAAAKARSQAMTDRVDKVLAPLPDTKASTQATITALGVMGEELDTSVRVKEFQGAAKSIKKAIDDLKAKNTPNDAAAPKPQAPPQ